MKAKVCGIEMNYELSGEGACLILIHGFSDNLRMWYNQVPIEVMVKRRQAKAIFPWSFLPKTSMDY